MSVTETLRGLGDWSVTLKDVPADIQDALQYYGHIAVHTGRVDYRKQGDGALTSSRYTGVLRRKELNDDALVIGGPGMAMWLGDEDQKGKTIETLLTITAQTFENTIRALLPTPSVIEGTLFNIGGSPFTGTFQFMSPREAIDYVTQTMGAEWRVNGDGTLDAGLVSDLFRVNPKTIIDRKLSGVDMALKGFLGSAKTDQDVEDFTTRVLLLASGVEGSVVTATADIAVGLNPYKDIRGNAIKMSRIVSESATDPTNAPARAQLQLNRFSDTRDAMTLDSEDYDIKGDLVVGDYMWVHDPEIDLVDGANEVKFRGKKLNPMKLRLTEMTWPVKSRYSVGFRNSSTGVWYNLTDYFEPETGSSTLIVGGYSRSLTGGGADGGAGGSRPLPNTSIPGIPVWNQPFIQSVYQSPLNGDTKAQVQLKWSRPNNVDGTTITDGDHYEVRWRNATSPLFPSTHAQLSVFTHAQITASGGTHAQPIQYPVGPWNYAFVPWSELTYLLQELSPNMPYEAQIRAVDGAVPPNPGDWSLAAGFQTLGDTLGPATPAPPEVYASRIAVQIVHHLGRSDGGTYNLDADLHHFEVHGSYEPNFEPTGLTLLGKIIANYGMITSQIPAVGSIQVESTVPTYFKVIAVDNAGNTSAPSVAVEQTALLIDNAHISDLTVSKVSAGVIQSDWLLGANIRTGVTGARVQLNFAGLQAFNAANVQTMSVDSATGDFDTIGSIRSGASGIRVEVNPKAGAYLPEIRMFPSTGSSFAVINSVNAGSFAGIGVNSGSTDGITQSTMYCSPSSAFIGRGTVGGPAPIRGGFFNGDDVNGRIGYLFPGGNEAFFNAGSDRRIGFKGVFFRGAGFGSQQALVTDFVDDNSFAIVAMAYGATMQDVVQPFVAFCSAGGTDNRNAVHVSGLSQTGLAIATQWNTSGPAGRFSYLMIQSG
jgi:hypothetical protein